MKTVAVPQITASNWIAYDDRFLVIASLRKIIHQHGNGVHTILLRDRMEGEGVVISRYSIFHGVTPPAAYSGDEG